MQCHLRERAEPMYRDPHPIGLQAEIRQSALVLPYGLLRQTHEGVARRNRKRRGRRSNQLRFATGVLESWRNGIAKSAPVWSRNRTLSRRRRREGNAREEQLPSPKTVVSKRHLHQEKR